MSNAYSLCIHNYLNISSYISAQLIARRSILLSLLPVYGNGLFWSLAPFLGWGRYAPEPYRLTCTLDWKNIPLSYTVTMFCFCYVIPLFLMVFSYSRIAITIKRAASNMKIIHTNMDRYVVKVSGYFKSVILYLSFKVLYYVFVRYLILEHLSYM